MQPHQLVLAIGILWLTTLTILPFFFAKARHRAFNRGLDAGKQSLKADVKLRIKGLQDDLDEAKVQAEADQRKHHTAIAHLKGSIRELEVRIMSYTGLAVTRADYELLTKVGETLQLAHRTMKALKSDQQASLATAQALSVDALAKRIHAQLRSTPATASTAEAAA
ncbi:hypothetical protein [Pseudomonas putida]|uniref:hypothetical protein n=1 Tax=Pseudomonas putida TaxID=303 RepID=UPI0015760564|nr:hypothetical protein [Pseudomonas putida]NTY91954.1 hypothetical protein [Pseudomonas putida]NTY99542.1 hypothetical protein [Pseudomonas putida]NTZ22075.1 hypothetical protein [Pseudomonas putida]NTZ55630.1 hypothetical protein [Pseudomonas putida]NTZ65551.1 hypothetical protein [Pseudomonas putida]